MGYPWHWQTSPSKAPSDPKRTSKVPPKDTLKNSQESSLAPQFKSISSSVLSLLYGPPLTSIHDYWKNHTDLCGQRLKAGGEGEDRVWDGWMTSPTRCTWVWVNSRSWWWTGRPGMLWFMGSQRVGHDWVTELTEQVWSDISLWFWIAFPNYWYWA